MWLGVLGPMVGGITFAYVAQDEKYWREYWLRIIDPTRISAKWYLVIFLFVPVLLVIAVLLDTIVAGNVALTRTIKTITSFVSTPLTIIPFALHALFYGPFPEELGWRGYALDQL